MRAARHACSSSLNRRTRSSVRRPRAPESAVATSDTRIEPRNTHLAHPVRLQQAKSGRNHDVSVLVPIHRTNGPGPNAARSESGSQSWLPDLEPHDVPGNARESASGLSAGREAGDAGSQWSRASRQDISAPAAAESWSSLEMIIDRPLATLNSSTKIREASAGPTAWRQLARKVHNVRADSSARVLGVSRSTRGVSICRHWGVSQLNAADSICHGLTKRDLARRESNR